MNMQGQMTELKAQVLAAFDSRDGKKTVELIGSFMSAGNTKATELGWHLITSMVKNDHRDALEGLLECCIENADPDAVSFIGDGDLVEGNPVLFDLPVPQT